MATPASSFARFRGSFVGAFTASLAAAAHGVVTGTMPTSEALALLVVLAAGIGPMTSASDRAGEPLILIGVLAAGQLGGHLVLGAGHNHAPAAGSVRGPPVGVTH